MNSTTGNNSAGVIVGTLNIQPGGTMNVLDNNGNSVLGGTSTAASNLTTLNINQGTLLNSSTQGQLITGATITMTGGTMATGSSGNGWIFYDGGGPDGPPT